jgi:hypothetical protein
MILIYPALVLFGATVKHNHRPTLGLHCLPLNLTQATITKHRFFLTGNVFIVQNTYMTYTFGNLQRLLNTFYIHI